MKPPYSKIAVIGSTNWDQTLQLPRLPQPKETLTGGISHSTLGGKGANQATAAARAGADVIFISAIGTDEIAQQVCRQLQRDNISTQYLIHLPDVATGQAMIFVDEHGENCIGVADGANALLLPRHVQALSDVISLCSYTLVQLEIPLTTVAESARLARQLGSKVILNPAPAGQFDRQLLTLCDLITPNQIEMEQICGTPVNDRAQLEQGAKTLLQQGVQSVLVTLGSAGVFLATTEHSEWVPAFSVPVRDTTGAGDVFNGALAVALSQGASLKEAAHFGCAAAALSVGKVGAIASIPTRSDINAFLNLD